MKEAIDQLIERKKKLSEQLNTVTDAIEALRRCCEHKLPNDESAFKCVGNDSHQDHYECSICGEMKYI